MRICSLGKFLRIVIPIRCETAILMLPSAVGPDRQCNVPNDITLGSRILAKFPLPPPFWMTDGEESWEWQPRWYQDNAFCFRNFVPFCLEMDGRSGFRLRPLERESARRGGSLLHFSSTQGDAVSVYSWYASHVVTKALGLQVDAFCITDLYTYKLFNCRQLGSL